MAEDSDLDLSRLTDEQQLALQQFTSVTDQDLNAALPLLRKCQWNVQIAIARFFDGDPPPEPENVPPPQPTRRQETLANGFGDLRHRPRESLEPAPRVVGLPENRINPRPPFLLSVVLTPINIALGLFSRLYGFLSYLFPFLPRLLQRLSLRATPALHRSPSPRPALSPYDTSARFQQEFTATYGSHPLPLLTSSYARAFDMAKSDVKFLLVVPLSPEHPETDGFVKNILLSPRVVEYVTDSDNNIIVWAGSVADSEPYQVATALNVTAFPSAVLIAHTPSVSQTAMSILARIRKPATPDEFVSIIRAAASQHAEPMARARATKTEQQAARNLRTEQESAYERSLAKDREKVRARRAADEERQRREHEEKAEQHRKEQYARDLAQWKQWRASNLPPEPEKDVKDAVRMSIRLLDGQKVMRRFPRQANIEDIYAFVECYTELKKQEQGEIVNEKQPLEPSNFKHNYGFRLVSPLPREVYKINQGGTVAQRLGRSANLIAERIEDDESDEEW